MTLDDATRNQVKAAAPDRSTWVAANAGSGKTRVLTDRVARLLLSGVAPQRILCLTYTKAAATEMQNRLFKRLGSWTMLPDDALRKELRDLGGDDGTAIDLENARTLFARAIETPGGLKIQTIHAFCAAILRRFPLEAGVSPQFRELDDRLAKLMQRDALEEIADAPDTGPVDAWMAQIGGSNIADALAAVVRNAGDLAQPRTRSEVWAAFDLPDGYSDADLMDAAFQQGDIAMLSRVAKALQGSDKKTDQSLAATLDAMPWTKSDASLIAALERALLATKAPYPPKKHPPTKDGFDLLSETDQAQFESFRLRLSDLRDRRTALLAATKTWALHQFAGVFLPAYTRRKVQGGWLDFDDLIQNARALLEAQNVAAWVLFRLDGGIDHILVDEAQDTSPDQWAVIRRLAEEFTAGQGARPDVERTIFVVGDKKQSIYSFQGADPSAFDAMRDLFDAELAAADRPLQAVSLDHSFRSSRAILDCVDATFSLNGQEGLGEQSTHIAFKDTLPGRVDLWPNEPATKPDPPVWHDTLDRISQQDPRRVLAERIAATIADMIGSEPITVDGKTRMVQPGDILILVQGRTSGIFAEVIRACKAAGLPMAGADRMNVAQELAVKDLTALLSFATTPEDDLSLAAVLKSPIFGWDEQMLFDLAHKRHQTYLWPALRDRKDKFPETVAILQDVLAQADFLRPYELLERILMRHDGRAKLTGRLGDEAQDAIDALLGQALSYETSGVPSLTGFLTWLTADELSIKRAVDGSANLIRVMTVHGAKGLEAPIVIMADTAQKKAKSPDAIYEHDGLPVWGPRKTDLPSALEARYVERAQKLADEAQRLLYVAMTRAESWLIVASAGELGKTAAASWYGQIQAGLESLGAHPADHGGLRYEPLGWPASAAAGVADTAAPASRLTLPSIATPKPVEGFMSPSDLGGAKVIAGTEGDPDATSRGSAIHALLEHLPGSAAADRDAAANALRTGFALSDDQWGDIRAEVDRVLAASTLAPVFGPGSLAEVPITARIAPWETPFYGIMDRVIISDDHVLLVDFKSNTAVPDTPRDVPEGLLRQMGAYAAMAAEVFAPLPVRTAILWTATGDLMHLEHQDVSDALRRAASP